MKNLLLVLTLSTAILASCSKKEEPAVVSDTTVIINQTQTSTPAPHVNPSSPTTKTTTTTAPYTKKDKLDKVEDAVTKADTVVTKSTRVIDKSGKVIDKIDRIFK